MIIRREKIYTKKVSIYREIRKRTLYCLLGIIPLYVNDEVLETTRAI